MQSGWNALRCLRAAPAQPIPGFGSTGYGVELQVQQTAAPVELTSFTTPLTVHLAAKPGALVPLASTDGTTWLPVPEIVDGKRPVGARSAYVRNTDGSFDIQTTAAGYFALLPDRTPPPPPATLTGHFAKGALVLQWPASTDLTGPAAGYRITLTNRPVLSVDGQTTASLSAFRARAPSVYRVIATDAAGNVSKPSKPLVVLPSERPARIPKILPAWAWELFTWQQTGKVGKRPAAPKVVPDWYWRWEAWRAFPFHIRA